MKKLWLLAVAAFCAFACGAAELKLSKEAVDIPVGGGEWFWLFYPEVKAGGRQERPNKVELSGRTATLSYAHGAKIEFKAADDHVSYRFLQTPGGTSDVRIHLVMPTSLGKKGVKWTVGSQSGGFPKAKGAVKLFQGSAGDFTASGAGIDFSVLLPETFCWAELQDLREWNWDAIGMMISTPFNADKRVVVIPFGKKSALAGIRSKAEAAFFAKHGNAAPRVVTAAAPRLAASINDWNVRLDCGSMGTFELQHPKLKIGGEDRSEPIERRLDGNVATLKYKNGGVLKVTFDGKRATYRLEQKPSGYGRPFQEMFVPFNFNQGGKWRVGGASGAFPLVKGGPKLHQGNGSEFAVSDPNNATLKLKFSTNPYIEVQDNREWGWPIFWTGLHLGDGLTDWTVDFSLDTSGFARKRLLDRFGQVPRDYPGKVKDEADLAEDVADEKKYYASLDFAGKMAKKGLKLDRFGGIEGTNRGRFKKTGFFHCEKKTVRGKDRWFLVDPEGNLFFHLGICGFGPSDDFTDVTGRQDAFEWLPPHDATFTAAWKDRPGEWWNGRAVSFYKANVIRKYGRYDDAAMNNRFIDRVRSVGFNSVGAFSGWAREYGERNFPFVGFVHLGNPVPLKGVRGMFDPFDEKSRREVANAMKGMARDAENPLIIGYFLANEQGLEDIPRAIPALGADSAAKREFVKFLERKYRSVAAFNAAWGLKEADFKSLAAKGLQVSTKAAFADVSAFTEILLEEYYSLIERNFRANDPNHMLIGNRWQPGTANNEILCRVAGRHLDVVSINYYTAGVDRGFMTRLYDWTGGKPQFWSEFYYTSTKESNCSPAGNDLATQKERGMAYRNYLGAAAELGFVVGVEWFTLIDQAATGRFFEGLNGERNNTGLFNVADRPYKDMFAQMLAAHLDLYAVWTGAKPAWKFDDPRYNGSGNATRNCSVGHPIAPMKIDGKQDGYPLRPPERISSDRLVLGRDADGLEASFKGAWDKENLYLIVTVTDKTPMCNKERGEWSWNGDGLEIFLGAESPEKGGPMLFTDRQILVSGAADGGFHVPKTARQPDVKTCVVPTADGKGYVVECAIPWSAIDHSPKENDVVLFDLGIDDAPKGGNRLRQLMWNGSDRNSSDRSRWGRLTLVP